MPDLVHVKWRDAWFDYEASDAIPSRDDFHVDTVGYVICEDQVWLSLAAEILPEGVGFRGISHIPQILILERELLRSEDGQ